MAKKTEDNKQELEQLTATESFFDKNKKYLIIAGGALLVIIVGFIAYQKAVVEPHAEESNDAYWNAFYEYQFNDSTELAYEGNDNFSGFEELSSDYDGTPGGEIATYGMATHAMDNGEWDDALSYLEDCDIDDIMLGNIVLGMMGDCYVELEDYETAAEKFEEAAAREPNEFTTPMYLKKAGLVYETLGQNDQAIVAYQKIKDNWSEAVEASDIDKYIVRAQN